MAKKTAIDVQVGGGHYKSLAIQPVEVAMVAGLSYCEGNLVKYLTRDKGNRLEDIKKAYHYLMLQQHMVEESVSNIPFCSTNFEKVYGHRLEDFFNQFKQGRVYSSILYCMMTHKYSKAREMLTKFVRYGRWEEI